MLIETSKVKIGFIGANHGGGATLGVIIIASNHRAAGVGHFTDRAEVISHVEVGRVALVLAVREELELHRSIIVAIFTLLRSAENKLARRIHRGPGLFHNLATAIESVVGKLRSLRRPGVADRYEPIGPVPLEGSCAAFARQVTESGFCNLPDLLSSGRFWQSAGSHMDLHTANALVQVVSENASHYCVATQRNLLDGIFQLADECKEDLAERHDMPNYDHFQTSLSLVKHFASEALKNGNLNEGFRLAAECFWPTAAVSQDLS